jgi:hypothetical protein
LADRPYRVLAGAVPISDCRLRQAGLAVVVCHQFGAGFDRVGEVALEQFSDLTVIVLAGAPK